MQRFFSYETYGFGFGGSERKKQLGTTGREAQKTKVERAGDHKGLTQRERALCCCCRKLIANGLLMDQELKRPGLGLQLGFIEDTAGLCICLK